MMMKRVDRMSRRLSALVFSTLGVVCGLGFAGLPAAHGHDGHNAAGAPAASDRAPAPEAGSGARNHKASGRAHAPIKLAITVDDMPGGGPEVHGYTHIQMVKDIVATLRAHRVPRAGGFVIGGILEGHPERAEALDVWLQAGFLVGNHSYSHPRLAELGLARFMDDITKNRSTVDALEKRSGQEHSYFRFPYLEEGASREERRALWHLLQREHYTLVRASVVFGDTDWADAYLRCQELNEQDSLLALDRTYLGQALAYLQWSVEAADDVLGHPIPLVLLLHVNVPTAKNLDALLRSYEAQGVQFVSLEEAMREPAYTVYYDVPGGDLLSQASAALGRPHPPKLPELDGLIDRLCR